MQANAEVMHTERFSEHNSGLPSMATGVAKGDDGFVWVSTLDGICRYDGYQFKTYRAIDVALLLCTSTAITLVPPLKSLTGKSIVPVMGSSPAYVVE